METRRYPQTIISPPSPPPTSPSRPSIPFPSPKASKAEVKQYVRSLLATYPTSNHNSFESAALVSRQKPAGGLSTLPSFRSIRPLSKIAPFDVAISKIWFDGAYLQLLVHIGNLRRELRLLGFEESTALWLNSEIFNAVQRLSIRGRGKYWERKMDQESENGKQGGFLRWLFRVC